MKASVSKQRQSRVTPRSRTAGSDVRPSGTASQGKKAFPPNRTGLPDHVKSGIENLSGLSMDNVRVHYNSPKPAQLQALAYTRGTDIHVAPGQERHVPHEAWHVVQQKQGRVQPDGKAKGQPVNTDPRLEHEADVMGNRALSMERASVSQGLSVAPVSSGDAIQRAADTSFPPDAEEEMKSMGLLQKKAVQPVIQCRGGAPVKQMEIKSSHVGSSLIAGHAWISINSLTGMEEESHGTWGNQPHIGYNRNLEMGSPAGAKRTTDLDATDLAAFRTFCGANDSWGYINNCSSFAARGWRTITGERLAYKTIGIPNPSALGVGIVAANGGATGVLPAGRGSSANSVSSTVSSSSAMTSNSLNSAVSSTSVGGSLNQSSGKRSF